MLQISSSADVSPASSSTKTDQNIVTAAKGGGIVFAGNLFQYGGRFLVGFLMARILGAEQLGLCNLALSVASIASGLALMGFPSAMVRYVALFSSRRDAAGIWGTLQVGLGLTAILGLITGISLYALADTIAVRIFHEAELVPLLRVISLVVPFLALSGVLAAATRGFKKMEYTVIGQSISQPLVRLIVIVVVVITVGLTATTALLAYSIAIAVGCALLLYFLNKLFSLRRPLREARRNYREILRFSLPIYMTSLISVFGGNLKTLLLGALDTITNVGIFTVATQVNTLGTMFHGSIVTATAPIVSELYDRQEMGQLERFYQVVTKWTFTVNLPLFLILLLFPRPILSLFGEGFVNGSTALAILAWANLVNTGTGICGNVIAMTGNTTLKMVNSVITIGLNIGLNVLLIPRWGIVGAATASLGAEIISNMLQLVEVFILFRMLPYNRSIAKPITAGLVALGGAIAVGQVFPSEANLAFAALSATILVASYVGMILLLGLSAEDRAVVSRVTHRIGAIFPK